MNCFNGKLEYIWFRFFLHDRQLKTFRKIRSKSKDCAEGNNVVLLSLLVKHITLGHSSFIQCIALNITTRKFYLIRNVRKEAIPTLGESVILSSWLVLRLHDMIVTPMSENLCVWLLFKSISIKQLPKLIQLSFRPNLILGISRQ